MRKFMKKITQKKRKSKNSYYSVISKEKRFLYGAFPPSKEGLLKAKEHLKKIDPSGKNYKIVKN